MSLPRRCWVVKWTEDNDFDPPQECVEKYPMSDYPTREDALRQWMSDQGYTPNTPLSDAGLYSISMGME